MAHATMVTLTAEDAMISVEGSPESLQTELAVTSLIQDHLIATTSLLHRSALPRAILAAPHSAATVVGASLGVTMEEEHVVAVLLDVDNVLLNRDVYL